MWKKILRVFVFTEYNKGTAQEVLQWPQTSSYLFKKIYEGITITVKKCKLKNVSLLIRLFIEWKFPK